MKIDANKLLLDDYSVFDGFVLWFPFNRDIQKIKTMPKNFKYVLLVNCPCSIDCNGTNHWLAKNFHEEYNILCPRTIYDGFDK